MYIGLRFRFGDGPLFAVARRHPDGQKPWEQKRRSYPETSVHGGLHAGNDIDTQQSRQYHHRHSLKQHHRLPGHIHLSRVELRIQNGARHFILLLFGEIIPKVTASHFPLRFASIIAVPLLGVRSAFKPLSWILVKLGERSTDGPRKAIRTSRWTNCRTPSK